MAELDGRVVGTLEVGFEARPRRNHAGSIGMAVHDDARSRGVGTALMAAVVDLSDRWLNLRRLELTVYVDNVAAIYLYRKFGFEIEGDRTRLRVSRRCLHRRAFHGTTQGLDGIWSARAAAGKRTSQSGQITLHS